MRSKTFFRCILHGVSHQTATILRSIGKDVSGYVVLGSCLNGVATALAIAFQYNHHLFSGVIPPKHSTSLSCVGIKEFEPLSARTAVMRGYGPTIPLDQYEIKTTSLVKGNITASPLKAKYVEGQWYTSLFTRSHGLQD